MNNAIENLKPIFLGCTTIILVGYVLSFLSAPIESFIVESFYPKPATLTELFDAMFWSSTVTISTGVLISFGLGGFVAAKTSVVRPILSALIPALLFVLVLWMPVVIPPYLGYTIPAIFSVASMFAAAIGGRVGIGAERKTNAI